MKGLTKDFNKFLYDEYNPQAVLAAIELYKNVYDIDAEENTKSIYDIDLILYRNRVFEGYCEVEVRPAWNTRSIGFSTLNIPSRKEKLLNHSLNSRVEFIAFNHDLSSALLLNRDIILSSPLKENKNKYVKDNEYFYSVSLSYATHLYKGLNGWYIDKVPKINTD